MLMTPHYRLKLITLLAVLWLVAPCPSAAAQQTVTRASLNGEWTGTLVLDNSQPRIALVFTLTDSTFAGKVYSDSDLMGEMEDGSLTGNRVHIPGWTEDLDGSRSQYGLVRLFGYVEAMRRAVAPL